MRISFSRSLLDHLATIVPGTVVCSVRLILGRLLAHGEESASGAYAVCKAGSGWPLRVPLFRALADHWRHPTRIVRECYLARL